MLPSAAQAVRRAALVAVNAAGRRRCISSAVTVAAALPRCAASAAPVCTGCCCGGSTPVAQRRLFSSAAASDASAANGATNASSPAAAPASNSNSSSNHPWPAAGGARVLDGLATSEAILLDLSSCVSRLRAARRSLDPSAALLRPPGLAVILATSARDSVRYVERKARAAQRVGFDSRTVTFDEDTVSEEEILEAIAALNADPSVDGVLVQLPLPAHVSQARILAAVAPEKDVDCFHPSNMGALTLFAARDSAAGEANTSAGPQSGPLGIANVLYHPWERRLAPQSAGAPADSSNVPSVLKSDAALRVEDPDTIYHVPCTPKACLELLDRYRIPLRGKHVVVLGRSASVGLPLTLLLLSRCASVTNIDEAMPRSQARDLCQKADVLIAAVGVPEYVRADWVKPGAAVVDVGINFVPKTNPNNSSSDSSINPLINPADTSAGVRLVGDVHAPSVSRVAGFLSPVPGGVGPMTVAMLMDNTLRAYIRAIEALPLAQSTVQAVRRQHRERIRQQRQDSEEVAKKQAEAAAAAAAAQSAPSASAAATPSATTMTATPTGEAAAALSVPLRHPPAPMLFLSGPPGAGKGTQASRLVADFGLPVRGIDGNDAPTPRSPNHAYLRLTDPHTGRERRFGVAHISVGALLRAQVSSPSPDLPAASMAEILRVLRHGGILRGALTVALLRAEIERLQRESKRIEPNVEAVFVIDGFPRSYDNLMQFEENYCPLDSILSISADDATVRARLSARGRADDTPPVITRRIAGFKEETEPAMQAWRERVSKRRRDTDKTNGDGNTVASGIATAASPAAPSTALASVAAAATPPATRAAHAFYVVDGCPSIEEVYAVVKPLFVQFVKSHF